MSENNKKQSILRSLLGKPCSRIEPNANNAFHNMFMTHKNNNVSSGQYDDSMDIEDYLSEDSMFEMCYSDSSNSSCGDSISQPISSVSHNSFPSRNKEEKKPFFEKKDHSKSVNESIMQTKEAKPALTAMQLIQRLTPATSVAPVTFTPMVKHGILYELDDHLQFLESHRLLSIEDAKNYTTQHRKHVLRMLGEMENSSYKSKLELIEEKLMYRKRPDVSWEGYNFEGKYYLKKTVAELKEDRERYELLSMQNWIKGKLDLSKRFEKINLKREQNIKFEREKQEFYRRLCAIRARIANDNTIPLERLNSMDYTSVILNSSIENQYVFNRCNGNNNIKEGQEEIDFISKCVELFPWTFSHAYALERDEKISVASIKGQDEGLKTSERYEEDRMIE